MIYRTAVSFFVVAVAMVLAAGAQAQAPPLLSYWTFDDGSGTTLLNTGTLGTAYNGVLSVASDNTGTITSPNTTPGPGIPLPTWTTGRFGGAPAFSGYLSNPGSPGNFALNYVAVPGTGGVGSGGGGLDSAQNVTTSMWVQWNGTQYQANDISGSTSLFNNQYGGVSLWEPLWIHERRGRHVRVGHHDRSRYRPASALRRHHDFRRDGHDAGGNRVEQPGHGVQRRHVDDVHERRATGGQPDQRDLRAPGFRHPAVPGANYFFYYDGNGGYYGTVGPGNDTMCDVGIFGDM